MILVGIAWTSRSWMRKSALAVLALAVLTSTALGSSLYLWCAPMASVMSDCCCPPPSAGDDDATALDRRGDDRISHATCCEAKSVVAATRVWSQGSEPELKVRHDAGLAPSTMIIPHAPGPVPSQAKRPARAGPPPPKIPRFLRIQSLLL